LVEVDTIVKRFPYTVVILRILLTLAFFLVFMWDLTEIAIVLYLAAFASDIVDGVLAKRQKTTSSSPLEAYLDPIADLVLVLMSFYAFSLKQFYPSWILLVFVLMFLFFIVSSNKRKPLYDPVGKYYGTFLMTTIGITLFFPTEPVFNGVLLLIIAYTVGLVIYRTVYLWNSRKEMGAQDSLGK
jgi:CDP-diacylglycerol--glycerol-3-phosphate 3-phosphatidyltransferase/cardiolipin synthase